MSFHWKVLVWMLAGVLFGLGLQYGTVGTAWAGATWRVADGGIELTDATGPAAKAKPWHLGPRARKKKL